MYDAAEKLFMHLPLGARIAGISLCPTGYLLFMPAIIYILHIKGKLPPCMPRLLLQTCMHCCCLAALSCKLCKPPYRLPCIVALHSSHMACAATWTLFLQLYVWLVAQVGCTWAVCC